MMTFLGELHRPQSDQAKINRQQTNSLRVVR